MKRLMAIGVFAGVALAAACGGGGAMRVELTQPPIVGAVTDRAATVVVRTSKPSDLTVRYRDGTHVKTLEVRARAEDDKTAHVEFDGLRPSTTYAYTVAGREFRFTTFPPPTAERRFTFVAISDEDHEVPAPVFERVAREAPAFVIQLGDFPHRKPAEAPNATIRKWWANHRAVLAEAPAGRDFARWLARFPLVHIWDDHDYGSGNADRTAPFKELATAAFLDYFPTYPLTGPGLWQRFRYAEAEFFVLDLRSQRDPDDEADAAAKSMLGKEQKAWLLDRLRRSSARWKFIVSSSVWNPWSKQVDSWALYRTEQRAIVDFIRRNRIGGVILMSGDLHSGGAIDNGTNSYFPEVSVPHSNLPHARCTGEGRVCGRWSAGAIRDRGGGYALFHVAPEAVTIQVKGADGVRRQLVVR
jgi:alkaline phosphatase D